MGSADFPIPAGTCTSATGARQKTTPRAGARAGEVRPAAGEARCQEDLCLAGQMSAWGRSKCVEYSVEHGRLVWGGYGLPLVALAGAGAVFEGRYSYIKELVVLDSCRPGPSEFAPDILRAALAAVQTLLRVAVGEGPKGPSGS